MSKLNIKFILITEITALKKLNTKKTKKSRYIVYFSNKFIKIVSIISILYFCSISRYQILKNSVFEAWYWVLDI